VQTPSPQEFLSGPPPLTLETSELSLRVIATTTNHDNEFPAYRDSPLAKTPRALDEMEYCSPQRYSF
jgi:hypothetical protein